MFLAIHDAPSPFDVLTKKVSINRSFNSLIDNPGSRTTQGGRQTVNAPEHIIIDANRHCFHISPPKDEGVCPTLSLHSSIPSPDRVWFQSEGAKSGIIVWCN
jgi:hypothetical protein